MKVAAAKDGGADDSSLTSLFAGQQVQWSGIVEDITFHEKLRGVSFRMEPVRIPMKNGIPLDVSFLATNVDKEDVDAWSGIQEGDMVHFKATICEGNQLFPGIRWSNLRMEPPEATIHITAVHSQPVATSYSTD